jgi:ABC-type lipoprotein release transport system permease subunit
VRAALAGAVAAVCAITAAAGFGASLTHLVSTPPAYGAAWDVAVGGFAPTAATEPVAGQLLANPEVAAVAALLGQSEVTVNGRLVSILAIEERKGALAPVVIEGREPLRPDEIALGSLTLRSLDRRVGDTVTLATERRPARPVRVVGRVVLHQPGCDCVITQGKGGIVHPALFRDLAPEPEQAYPSTFLDVGVDRDRAMARLRREFAGTMFSPRPHADVRNLQRVADLPALLGALVVLVALGTVAHAVVTSVRRRRRDLAVLKALGLVRGQVAATIAWQATTFAVVALGLGVPLGVAVGRWAWQLTAAALGVASGPVVPLLAMGAVAIGMVLAVNLVAAVPGWAAGRLRPATALRSE